MNKKAAIWIFGVAASISAIASVIALNFETYFSRNSNDPDLIQAYCMFGGLAMFLLSFFWNLRRLVSAFEKFGGIIKWIGFQRLVSRSVRLGLPG
jgi:hypothetical protein